MAPPLKNYTVGATAGSCITPPPSPVSARSCDYDATVTSQSGSASTYRHNPYAPVLRESECTTPCCEDSFTEFAAVPQQYVGDADRQMRRKAAKPRQHNLGFPTPSLRKRAAGAGRGRPDSSASGTPKTMCCYFKQQGWCRMGEHCWHGHEGDIYTPCHYGANCKAGHATLVAMAVMIESELQTLW